jgi:hypothetical protein
MESLPHTATFTMSGAHLAVIHGGVTQTNKFIFPATPDEDLHRELQLSRIDGVIAEHSEIPHSRQVDSQLWHNARAIGMPENDETPRLWNSVVPPALTLFILKFRRWTLLGAALWPKFVPPDCPSHALIRLKPGYGPVTKLCRPVTGRRVNGPSQNRYYNDQRGA